MPLSRHNRKITLILSHFCLESENDFLVCNDLSQVVDGVDVSVDFNSNELDVRSRLH